MNNFWKVLTLIVVLLTAMILITYLNPEIKKFASGVADRNNLPLWFVGLAAPILYVVQRIKNFFSGLLRGSTEKSIAEENESIKNDMAKLRQDVDRLDEWRLTGIDKQMVEAETFRTNIGNMKQRASTIKEQIRNNQSELDRLHNEIEDVEGVSF